MHKCLLSVGPPLAITTHCCGDVPTVQMAKYRPCCLHGCTEGKNNGNERANICKYLFVTVCVFPYGCVYLCMSSVCVRVSAPVCKMECSVGVWAEGE